MSKTVYFKNLNALRFIAAFLVIIHHIEQFKNLFGLSNHWSNPFIREVGGLGVTLFFVLSGFLITYLLLQEKLETQNISIRDFYMRRILRIWPLYYFIVVLGFFILPYFSFFSIPDYEWKTAGFMFQLFLFFVFLPNLANILYLPVPFVSQTWSVGVEEQFYLIWPLLVKKFEKILLMLSGVLVFYLFAKFALIHFSIKLNNLSYLKTLSEFWNGFRIGCMAIGGFSSYVLFYQKNRLLNFIFRRYFQVLAYSLTFFLIVIGYTFPLVNHEIYALLFSFIILNLAANPASVLNLEYAPLNYLGKISYGLYMYHSICIVAGIKICLYLNLPYNWLFFSSSMVLSILFSSLSYELFEKRFIKLKKKYSTIQSGAEALEIEKSAAKD